MVLYICIMLLFDKVQKLYRIEEEFVMKEYRIKNLKSRREQDKTDYLQYEVLSFLIYLKKSLKYGI